MKGFQKTCLTVLHSMASMKGKFTRANQTSFMNKELQQAIMIKSKFRDNFLKSRSLSDKNAYNKQGNASVSLLRKRKRKRKNIIQS